MEMIPSEKKPSPTLPDDIIVDCIVPRVPTSNYPVLSLVSKQFQSLVASPELYMRRSILGCVEQCVYVLVADDKTCFSHWYILNRRTKRNMPGTVENRLVPVMSLPDMPVLGSYIAVGSKIFVMGGFYGRDDFDDFLPKSPITLCIDCQTHTVRRVANMPAVVTAKEYKVTDEKIYLWGRPVSDPPNTEPYIVMVFDLRTETWEHGTKSLSEVDPRWHTGFPIVGEDYHKLHGYLLGKEVKWGTDEIMKYRLCSNECVMDGILYKYAHYGRGRDMLETYDPNQRIWGVVKGLKNLPLGGKGYLMVVCGKKLILFLENSDNFEKTKSWCAEITVERRQGGEIWGKVECCDLVLVGSKDISKCLVVTL